MKKEYAILLLFFTLLISLCNYAQVSIEKSILNTNLFEKFLKGSVLMKNGRVEEALLNYDTESKKIVFKKDEAVLVLIDLPSVDTVYIENRKFIPLNNTFYEVATGLVNIDLYITYSNKRKPLMASPDHSGTTRQTGNQVNNNVASAYVNRPNQLNYAVEILTHYWLKKGNSLYKANNQTQLLTVFPFKDHEAIKNYIRDNNIDFSKPDDIVKLVNFCNSLIK